MSNARNILTTPTEEAVANGLQLAREAADKLTQAGCKVVGATVTPRGATVHVASPPPFVTGSVRMKFPNPSGGVQHVMATRYFGVQLEWWALVPSTQAVGHA